MAHGGDDSSSSVDYPHRRWYIALSAAIMNALQSGGFFFTPTTLMPSIVKDFSLPLSLSTVAIAVGKVAYVLLLIPGGILVDSYGPRRCVLLGILGLATVLTLYAAFASTFWMLLVMHVMMATVASVSGVPVYSIFIAQWFEEGIGLAMGLVLAGYSAAGTCIPALLGPVASTVGWRVAMSCMCGLLWFVGLPVTYFHLHEHPNEPNFAEEEMEEGEMEEEDMEEEEDISLEMEGVKEEHAPLLREEQSRGPVSHGLPDEGFAGRTSWTFVGFAVSYILLQYCFGCFGENVMFFLTIDRDLSLGIASLFFSALNLSAFTAKLVGGHLGDKFDRFHVASASSGLAAIGIVFLFLWTPGLDSHHIPYLTSSPIAVLMFTVLFGFGYGSTFNCLYALTPIVFGKQNLGRTQSTLFGLGLAGNAVGSVMTGVMRSHYGTYQRPFLVAAMACATNFLVFNVTRMTLGGSLESLQLSRIMKQSDTALSDPYQGIDELGTQEEATRLQAHDFSDQYTSPNISSLGNVISEQRESSTYGATFIPGAVDDMHSGEILASDSFLGIPKSWQSTSAVQGGDQFVRDWSSLSLRAYLSSSSSGMTRPRSQKFKKSSTSSDIKYNLFISGMLEPPPWR